MTQKFINRIAKNYFDYNRDTIWGKYRYSVDGCPPKTGVGPWGYWIVRCPKGGENEEFLTPDGRIISRWEKIVKL